MTRCCAAIAFAIPVRVRILGLAIILALSCGCGPHKDSSLHDLTDTPSPVVTTINHPSTASAGTRVDPQPSATLPYAEATAKDAEPAPPTGPLTLQKAIALSFKRNPDVLAAAERIAVAQARVREASAAFYPHFSTRLSYARTTNPLEAFGMIVAQRSFSQALDVNHPGATQNVRPEIVATLPLFRGGQDYERRAVAALGAEAAIFERAAVRNVLAENVAAAYYALAAAPEQVEATRASIEAVESALAATRARFAAGTALRSDALSLEVRLASARQENLRAENALDLARTALAVLLGLPADTALEIAVAPDEARQPLPDAFSAALEQALARRPEVAAVARVVAMRERELRFERAAYLPRIDGVARYGQDAPDLELSSRQDNWTVGATAEIDLFSGFQTVARVRAALHRLAEARRVQEKTRLEIERDVKTALLDVAESRQQAQVAETGIRAADEALKHVGAQYRAGTTTVTRYLEAETARAEARSRAIAARYQVRRSEAALARAIGAWGNP